MIREPRLLMRRSANGRLRYSLQGFLVGLPAMVTEFQAFPLGNIVIS